MSEIASPVAAEPVAAVSTEQNSPAPVETTVDNTADPAEGTEAGAEDAAEDKKPEKTAEQREIDRMRRGIDRKTRQLAEARAQLALTRNPIERNNETSASDSEPLSLTRAELAQLVRAEAEKLAPTVKAQQAEFEQRQGVIAALAKTWGQAKFDSIAANLNEAFGGDEETNALLGRDGRPKPAADAIFTADSPQALIEYLADPDNADEAERIAGMGPLQAGRAIAKLEAKLDAVKASDKPQISKAPKALEAIQGNSAADSQFNQSLEKASFAQYEAMRKKSARWAS